MPACGCATPILLFYDKKLHSITKNNEWHSIAHRVYPTRNRNTETLHCFLYFVFDITCVRRCRRSCIAMLSLSHQSRIVETWYPL